MSADTPDRPRSSSKRPNILLITTDQQHPAALGCFNPEIKTPNLDRLCREGTRFDRAYCNNPLCSPSRATILTGLYPSHHHCWTIGVKLPEDVPTIGGYLNEAGYHTNLIGKAHFQPLLSRPGSESIECQPILRDLEFWKNFHGPWYGFQHIETARMHAQESHAGQHYALWLEEKGLANWRDYFDPVDRTAKNKYDGPWYIKSALAWDLPEPLHHSHWVGERTAAAMDRAVEEDKPFFIWSSFFDPHPPYVVPEPWASMYDPAKVTLPEVDEREMATMPPLHQKTRELKPDYTDLDEPNGNYLHGLHGHHYTEQELRESTASYYGMISLIDQEVGRLLDHLDRLGIAENTLVIFTTDHGHLIGQHGLIAKGVFHYEDILRLPFIVRQPGTVPAGRVSTSMQGLVDLAPTFLQAAGQTIPGMMQGVSQWDVWRGEAEKARDNVIVENRHNPTKVHLRTYINDRYKLTVYRGQTYGELFDLKEDPGEHRNLWADPASRALKGQLMEAFIQAEIAREPTRMARIAAA